MASDPSSSSWSFSDRIRTPFYYYGVGAGFFLGLAGSLVSPGPLILVVVLTLFATVFMATFLAFSLPPAAATTRNGPLVLLSGVVCFAGALAIRFLNS